MVIIVLVKFHFYVLVLIVIIQSFQNFLLVIKIKCFINLKNYQYLLHSKLSHINGYFVCLKHIKSMTLLLLLVYLSLNY